PAVVPTVTGARPPCAGRHPGGQCRRGLGGDGERQLPEAAGEDHAVLPARRLDRDVLVEYILEDALGWPVERIAPPATSPVVVLVTFARIVLDVGGALARLVRLVSAGTHHQPAR